MRLIELTEIGKKRGNVPDDMDDRKKSLGWMKASVDKIKELGETCNDKVGYTWLGQSCGILQSGNKMFLMDPLFEDWIVNKWVGPRRIVPSPLNIDEMMELSPDYVVVSHDHPDHLGDETTRKFSQLDLKWIVPFGVKDFLLDHNVKEESIIEMKWWEKQQLDSEFEIVCLPAMHWSGRKLYDANQSLWSSFMILKKGRSIFYHGGDTGYVDGLFKKIGDKYGPITLAALPIGQYCPEWHQKPRHISPLESIKMMKEMKVENMVGVHWGTFTLSSEDYLEPADKLTEINAEGATVPQPGFTNIYNISK
ncbi:N-acyl-phosphatidylethanolamine-hydrolyzing phospholipase D, mitochondrial [Pichia kudriavzevii]|nr:N-acyl-phosphatidylethanolamine-hydrolyzing phospholipase D, mitochondrial [Pichia kudriavzevii]